MTLLRRPRSDAGMVSAFTIAIAAGLLALLGLVTDGGLVLAAKVEASGQAQEAARAGARNLDLAKLRTDRTMQLGPGEAQSAADTYLRAAGATGQVRATTQEVTVTVERTQRTQLLSLVGITSLRVTATATARAAWQEGTS
ncbi:pilus assembly protein TadG-related protein [Kitasatospora sp. NPDC001175]|uniref:pilus assembly protein TadG-related protein n=1 Tax=Kitasatospora sp. NPDC001175 TaxID=3157103 RepID=UPI003CFEB473